MGYQGWTLDGDEAESNPTIGPPKKKREKNRLLFQTVTMWKYFVMEYC